MFDYKKEYKEFYLPTNKPQLIEIPTMNFVAVRGKGNPNDPNGEYKKALEILYAISYTIKMSYKTAWKIDGFFEYVVPPLEGFWWMEGISGIDYSSKELFNWISVIRLPDFIKKSDFDFAVQTATQKKNTDFSQAEFFTYTEGLCVQCMHKGPYDNEPETIRLMTDFADESGCISDICEARFHHELYMSDVRKCKPENLKTVIRHPVKRLS